MLRFFVYLISWGIRTPRNVEELDLELAEFVNHLWQDDLPEQHAMDALSGFARLLPHCRGKLPIARSYFANWRKTLVRVRALPLIQLMVTGARASPMLPEGQTSQPSSSPGSRGCCVRTRWSR